MILPDYYKFEQKLQKSSSRYDVTASTGSYELFENLLINKKAFNVGSLSLNLVQRPEMWKGKKTDLAITKGNSSITSVKRPDIETNAAFGDINGTKDACIILFNPDFKEAGITTIEIFIGRGYRNDTNSLWNEYANGELNHEIEGLRAKAVTKNVTGKP